MPKATAPQNKPKTNIPPLSFIPTLLAKNWSIVLSGEAYLFCVLAGHLIKSHGNCQDSISLGKGEMG
jgi:hypothetical protein